MANSIIEKGLSIEGSISSAEGSIEIKGKVIGDIAARSVVVQKGGATDGKLSAESITIAGKHRGRLQCDDLTLETTSEVRANVKSKTLMAESGTKITGKMKITGKQ